jgi:hypothetical protein
MHGLDKSILSAAWKLRSTSPERFTALTLIQVYRLNLNVDAQKIRLAIRKVSPVIGLKDVPRRQLL